MRKGYFTKEICFSKEVTGLGALESSRCEKVEDYWKHKLGDIAIRGDVFIDEYTDNNGREMIRVSCDVLDDVGDLVAKNLENSWVRAYNGGLEPIVNVKLLRVVG